MNSTANLSKSMISEGVQNSTNNLDEDVKSQQFEESFIFPLFSEISRVTKIPSIFCIIQIIIQLMQSLIANLFIGNLHIWKSISTTPKVLRYLSYAINFGVIDILNEGSSDNNDNITKDNFFNCLPVYLVVIIFVGVEIIYIITLLFYYRKKRLFEKWMLYVANALFSTLNSILFAPICGILGYALWQVDLHQSMSSIVYFILSIISLLLIILVIVFNDNFACNSTYLSKSIDSCWDARTKNLFTLTIGASSFLAPALNPFSNWFVFVGFLAIILVNCYQLYLMYYLPYIKEMMNSIIQASLVFSIIAIILSIAHYFTDINSNVLIFVPIAAFVVFIIFYFFFDKYRIKKILTRMDSKNEENTEEEMKEFLNSISNGSDDYVNFCIHVGIAYMSPVFVDYSIMKYILSVKQTPKVMFLLIQLTAMLPSQMQFLSMVIGNVTTNFIHFTIVQKFILYQARKVNVLRQSVSSKEERSEAKRLLKMSEETISLVRGFWAEISHLKSDISTASLRYFRNATNRTSSSYLDAIEQYPRSHYLYNQYIRFLIEAKGDFKESIKYTRSLNMIEENKKIVHDYAFCSFANTFPKYLTDKILDVNGMYINKQDKILSNEMESTANSSKNSSAQTLNKTYHDDEISATIFDHSKLRLSLQEIINKSSMNSLNLLRGFSFFTFLLICIIIVVLLVVVTSSSKSIHSLVKSISLTSKILTNIQYTGLIIGTRLVEYFTSDKKYVNEYPDIINNLCYHKTVFCDQLSIDNTSFPDEPSIYNDPLVKINMVASDIRSYVQEEIELIFSNPSLHIGEIALLNEWSMDSNQSAYYNISQLNYPVLIGLTSSLQGMINMALRQIETISSFNVSRFMDEEFTFILKQDYLTLTTFNYIYIGDSFNKLFYNISQKGINDCDRYSNTYDIMIYIISIAAVIIFFIFRLINFIYIRKEFKNLSHLLQGFNKDDINASSKPIYLKNKEPLPTGTVHSAHDFSIELYALPLTFLLITAVCVIIVVYICTQTQDYYSTFANVFEWSHGAALRSSIIMQTIIAIHFDNCAYREDYEDIEFVNLSEKIKQVMHYQNLIDMEIIGKDSRIDEFYYFNHCNDFKDVFDFADFSDCLSVSNKINAAINQLIELNREFEERIEIIYAYDYAALMYNIDKSIYTEFISFLDYLDTFSQKISDENNSNVQAFGIIGIIIVFIIFIIENVFISMLFHSLEGFKQLIYTLSPISACRNRSLMLFLSHKKMNDDSLPTVDLVLNNSQFSIVTINENFIIQTINQEFSKLTNYSSQNLLGQSITYLIPLPIDENGKIAIEKSAFYSAINQMRDNFRNVDSCSVKVKLRKEDLEIILMNANVIKIKDSSESFKGVTLLLKSSEENNEMKNRLDEEKMNVNNLIKVLIPRGALNSVKGKKNSTFYKADEATLIFIEITGISDCISMMSPKGILDILQQIYNGIKMALENFESISMLRWENEMIFAVSGLFDSVGDFKKQAYETIAFMIEILQNLEETNIQTNTDFHFRLGAHIGGPVMGFIKDPSTPYFNILSSSFKYLNFMKENCSIDRPWVTASLAKHLDLNIFDIQKETSFSFDEIEEDIYSVQFKEGCQPHDDVNVNENVEENVNESIENIEEEEEQINADTVNDNVDDVVDIINNDESA